MKRKFRASETQKSSNASAIDVADPSGCTVVDSNVPNGRRTADASAAASSPGPKRRRKHTSAAQEVDSSVATSPTAVEHSGSTTVSGEPAEEPCANDEPDDATPVGIDSRAMAESSEHLNVVNGGHHQDTTGFTVLEDQRRKGKLKVHRALPAWLAKPSVIKADIHNEKADLGSVVDLCPMLQERLRSNGITHLFPVQQFVIPVVLDTIKHGWYLGRGGYRPSDLCCSAPTGSGKTLAFVLPIVQALQHRVVPRVRALVVLPVRDLAVQVYKVFHSYTEHTSLRVVLIVGQKNLASEQASLVKRSCKAGEYESLADIVVATPGRLVDHIHTTQGFDLSQLRFLVIDEADRMMDEIKQDWLGLVEGAVCRHSDRDLSNTVTAAQESRMQIPLQKLLFSATLSQNPEKLQQLNLFQPKLYTSVPDKASNEKGDGDGEALASRFEGKYTTPTTLAEYFIECTSETKPLVLMYLIMTLKFKRVLCFTNSVETTWRLYNLLDLVGGGIVVQQFSSAEPAYKRSQLVKQFEAGKVNILVCSDAMARGMDVKGVQCVISYDNPAFVKTYIHRVGRTARAGKAGTAISFLEKKQVHHFKEMMKSAGKGKNVTEMKVKKSHLRPLVDTYTTALQRLPSIL